MEKLLYKLDCHFKLDPETFVGISNSLEISLPCINCKRNHRTVLFEDLNSPGICTPSEKCDGFSGQITSREVIKEKDGVLVQYQIDLDYFPFTDAKYGKKSSFKSPWARVSFQVKCPACDKQSSISTQENYSRPLESKCECGNSLYKDKLNPFHYEIPSL